MSEEPKELKSEEGIKLPELELPKNPLKEVLSAEQKDGVQEGITAEKLKDTEEIKRAKSNLEELDIRKSPEQIALENLEERLELKRRQLIDSENELEFGKEKARKKWEVEPWYFRVFAGFSEKRFISMFTENLAWRMEGTKKEINEISEEIDFYRKKGGEYKK